MLLRACLAVLTCIAPQLLRCTELPDLRRLLRERLLAEAQVVACTLSGSGMDALQSAMGGRGVQFDVVVVDEATQSSEVELLIALQHGCTLACLVGDPPCSRRRPALQP